MLHFSVSNVRSRESIAIYLPIFNGSSRRKLHTIAS